MCHRVPSPFASRLAAELEEAHHLAPTLRSALAAACRSDPPVRSVGELAARAGCHRRTLNHHWSRGLPAGMALRLEDFLGWLLLVRASQLRARTGWTEVAGALGVHEHTLARLAKRLAGATLREAARSGPDGIARAMELRLAPMLARRERPP